MLADPFAAGHLVKLAGEAFPVRHRSCELSVAFVALTGSRLASYHERS
jgi:hypothetical protein